MNSFFFPRCTFIACYQPKGLKTTTTTKTHIDKEKFGKWYEEHNGFVKEGVCTDYKNRTRIAKLLRYETNKTNKGEKVSLEEYIDHMKDDQKEVFYLVAPNKESAIRSPYLEAFQDSDTEVLLCYAQIDEFCMKNLGSYRSKEITGIESSTAVTHSHKDES